MNPHPSTYFVPQIIISHGTRDLGFYETAFGAVVKNLLKNDDGSIHVAEMFIDGALVHFHEENYKGTTFSPDKHNGVTTIIGLMVEDVDAVMSRAVEAGAKVVSPAESYDYGYRQGTIVDPLGHHWQIEKLL